MVAWAHYFTYFCFVCLETLSLFSLEILRNDWKKNNLIPSNIEIVTILQNSVEIVSILLQLWAYSYKSIVQKWLSRVIFSLNFSCLKSPNFCQIHIKIHMSLKIHIHVKIHVYVKIHMYVKIFMSRRIWAMIVEIVFWVEPPAKILSRAFSPRPVTNQNSSNQINFLDSALIIFERLGNGLKKLASLIQ